MLSVLFLHCCCCYSSPVFPASDDHSYYPLYRCVKKIQYYTSLHIMLSSSEQKKLTTQFYMHSPSSPYWLVHMTRFLILEAFPSLTSYWPQLTWSSFLQWNAIHLLQSCYSCMYNLLSIIGCVKPPCDAIRGPAVRWKLEKDRCIRVTL